MSIDTATNLFRDLQADDTDSEIIEIESLCLQCKENDLSRQVVKTEWATLKIPELEFEIPHRTQEGAITTIEGIIQRIIEGITQRLETLQSEKIEDECTEKLQIFVKQLDNIKTGNQPFTLVCSLAGLVKYVTYETPLP